VQKSNGSKEQGVIYGDSGGKRNLKKEKGTELGAREVRAKSEDDGKSSLTHLRSNTLTETMVSVKKLLVEAGLGQNQ